MSLARGFSRWMGQFFHTHRWTQWRVRRIVIEHEYKLAKHRQCEVCGEEQLGVITEEEGRFWS